MARSARRALADSRAIEEESSRVTLHGGSKFIGAGGVPSMGLSQYVGGGRYVGGAMDSESDSSDEECEMCGGAAPAGTTYRLALQRGTPRTYAGPSQTAIVPFVPQAPRGPLTRYTAPRALKPTPTTLATRVPGTMKPYSAAEAAARIAAIKQTGRAPTVKPSARGAYAQRIAQLLAMGIPLAALGAYLGDAAASGASADAGYYDDYVGEPDADGDGIPDSVDPTPNGESSRPVYEPPIIDYGAPTQQQSPITDLSAQELKFYLQSGNLPDRFYSGPRTKRGGKKHSSNQGRRSERAAIVKKVMAEKGMKMIEASKYVKANNLY